MPNAVVSFVSSSKFILEGGGVAEWREGSRVFIDGAQFSPSFKKGWWDGYQYLGNYNQHKQLVLTRGILGRVIQDLSATVVKLPSEPAQIIEAPAVEGLRDYQLEALRRIFEARWGRIALATNAGKGAIIAVAAQRFAQYSCPVIILCDEIAPYNALCQEIQKWTGKTPGQLKDDTNYFPLDNVVVAMVPTLHTRSRSAKIPEDASEAERKIAKKKQEKVERWRQWLGRFRACLLDEADKSASRSWLSVLDYLDNTHYRIGFSGTFLDQKEMPHIELILSETIGPVLQRVGNKVLIERGISAKPLVELVPCNHPDIVLPPKSVWKSMPGAARRQYIYDAEIVNNGHRHALIRELLAPSDPNAVVVNYVEHGRQLAATLPDARFLFGEDPKEVRLEILDQFKKGHFQNLVVSKILDRGSNDLGHAVGLVFASAQGSLRQTLQRVGRGLRRAGGKEFLFLKDIMDRGFPYFDVASKRRVALYNEEGFDITIRAEARVATSGIRIMASQTPIDDLEEDPTLDLRDEELAAELAEDMRE